MNATPSNGARDERLPSDPVALGLQALAWTVDDAGRAERLLALTGIAPEALRARAADPALLAAVLGFLEAHEPDLVACAAALALPPDALVAARTALER